MMSNDEKPKMGRPRKDTEALTVRMSLDMIAAIDGYRRTQDDLPSRPEAIRRMVLAYLSGKTFSG